jgi:polyisoprenyl-phosphate glycosyltransferase
MVAENLQDRIQRLKGPILILGASGFVGANLIRTLSTVRNDVHGTTTRRPAWRLEFLPQHQVHVVDLLIDSSLDQLLQRVKPRTILDCVAFGAYSFETEIQLIYQTNFSFKTRLLERSVTREIECYVHAGSSSEYGDNAAGPDERAPLEPNSHYAVSKAAAANLISFYGRHRGLPCVNLRLYSVYGPWEDSSRLIPNLIRRGLEGGFPEFVNPEISRDFIYVDDVTSAFVCAALHLKPADYGQSFNIGSGQRTTIAELSRLSAQFFEIAEEPKFTMPVRDWDVTNWYARIDQARERLHWEPQISLDEGLRKTAEWMRILPDLNAYERTSKKYGLDLKHSVSAIIACYNDLQAIPVMYSRLTKTFHKLNLDYEIIFVNDCSPDDSEEVIRKLSLDDRRVVGISHSRNFGSQAAFMSGLAIARKNSCVLLDGDLQDPPEFIEQFVAQWREGYDVVYGRRVKREATLFMQFAYKAFYRIFDFFSYVPVPHDAGDFSLMDRRVVQALLRFPERDLFLRGIRAFAGFKQIGVDYVRPERMFGRTTNSLFKNFGWAKKGILSFSNTPLNMISVMGSSLLGLTAVLAIAQIVYKLVYPAGTVQGITTVVLVIMFFGSLSIFSIAVLGEYLAKVFEEVKRRPLYIRRSVIRDGEIRAVNDDRVFGTQE